MQNNREVGARYEERVADYLKKRGYRILERNFRCHLGEIDLIAKLGRTVVFVEVKYRRTEACGEPAEAVDLRKQTRVSNAASYYLYTNRFPSDTPCRFDVAAICGTEIRLIENAFPYCGKYRF